MDVSMMDIVLILVALDEKIDNLIRLKTTLTSDEAKKIIEEQTIRYIAVRNRLLGKE